MTQHHTVLDKVQEAVNKAAQESEAHIQGRRQELTQIELLIAEKTDRLHVLAEGVKAQEKKYMDGHAEMERLRKEYEELQEKMAGANEALVEMRKRFKTIRGVLE
jgi:predicted aminopeptidase